MSNVPQRLSERQLSGLRQFNEAERDFIQRAQSAGWNVTRRGWPDFFCWKSSGEVVLVEVKPNAAKNLKREQFQVAQFLAAHGIKVFRWDPQSGFTKIVRPGVGITPLTGAAGVMANQRPRARSMNRTTQPAAKNRTESRLERGEPQRAKRISSQASAG